MINPDDHFTLLFWSNVKSARIYNFQHEFEIFAHCEQQQQQREGGEEKNPF